MNRAEAPNSIDYAEKIQQDIVSSDMPWPADSLLLQFKEFAALDPAAAANTCFQTALLMERLGRFREAISILEAGYALTRYPLFRFEAAGIGITALSDRTDRSEELLDQLIRDHLFSPAIQLKAVLEYIRSNGNLVTIADGGVEVVFTISALNWEIEWHWIERGLYERQELLFLKDFLPARATVLDIGANVGNHTVFLGKCRPDLTLIPFEPAPNAVRLLNENIQSNNLQNVEIDRLGFAVSDSHLPVNLQFRTSLSSTICTSDNNGISVPCISLHSILEDRKVDLIKIDVEGMEVQILESVIEQIKRRGTYILMEVLESDVAGFTKFVGSHGLRIAKCFPMDAGTNVLLEPCSA
jgi:FkbM family methyltransferase